jgi:pimeloyl-ACP methyl ester carboxylesterase
MRHGFSALVFVLASACSGATTSSTEETKPTEPEPVATTTAPAPSAPPDKTSPGPTTGPGKPDAGPAEGAGPYGADGPSQVSKATASLRRPGGSAFDVEVHVPSGSGPFPTVLLLAGGQQPAAGYVPYAKRLASWGIATVLRDDPGLFGDQNNYALDVAYLLATWLPGQQTATQGPLAGKVNATKLGLAGHSRGARIGLYAAQTGAKGSIKGFFGLDPVDDRAPYGRTSIATMGVPFAFIGETFNSTGSRPCAPAESNYKVLYDLVPTPAVAITAKVADHSIFQDPDNCSFCGLCPKATDDPVARAKVLAFSVRYLTAFFARELKGDSSVGPDFAGAGAKQDIAAGLITIESK